MTGSTDTLGAQPPPTPRRIGPTTKRGAFPLDSGLIDAEQARIREMEPRDVDDVVALIESHEDDAPDWAESAERARGVFRSRMNSAAGRSDAGTASPPMGRETANGEGSASGQTVGHGGDDPPPARHYVVELGHRAVAVGGYEPRPGAPDTFLLTWLFVDPYCQARGLGSALLNLIEVEVREWGGSRLEVERPVLDPHDRLSDEVAEHFLAANAFKEVGQRQNSDGHPVRVFVKVLG